MRYLLLCQSCWPTRFNHFCRLPLCILLYPHVITRLKIRQGSGTPVIYCFDFIWLLLSFRCTPVMHCGVSNVQWVAACLRCLMNIWAGDGRFSRGVFRESRSTMYGSFLSAFAFLKSDSPKQLFLLCRYFVGTLVMM